MLSEAQQKLIFDRIGYRPTAAQEAVHASRARIRLVAGGERSGKSYSSAMDYMSRFWETPLLWLVGQDYARTGAEFGYICDGFDKLGIEYQATKNVDPGEILVDGGIRIATKSAQDPRKLAMEAPTGVIICEGSQVDYETFLRLRGRLIEKRGWLLMSGTFESSLGWYVEMFNLGQAKNDLDLVSFSLPTWSNTVIFPGGREDPEIKLVEAVVSAEWFSERFGGVPMPPKGLVFIEFRNEIHTGIGGDYEFNPAETVHLFVDPGYASAYVVLAAQKRGEHLYVFDEVYERGLITTDIIKVCKQKPWWNKVVGGAIDIAAKQHQAMEPPVEVWASESGVVLRSQKLAIRDGIEQTKRFLLVNPITHQPLLHINARCKGLISEMGGCPNPVTGQTAVYRWKLDRDGNVIGETPEDKDNHSCKSLSYGLVDLFGFSMVPQKVKTKYF